MAKCIKNVKIVPGCISCGSCEAICPKVFEVKDIAYVKKGVDFNTVADDVREAADMCPVNVIQVEDEK